MSEREGVIENEGPLTYEQVHRLKALWVTPRWRRPLLRLLWRIEAIVRG